MHITPGRTNFNTDVQESVWNTRGWVLQERNLSRRVLVFGDRQTFFECQRQSAGEDGRDLSLYQGKRFGAGSTPQGDDWEWCLLIEDYTSRNLTSPNDKLFAIEGMARNFAARTGRPYCAGMWIDRSPLHLLWYGKRGPLVRPLFDGVMRRAPSWSWGSIDGPVMWEPFMMEAKTDCSLTLPPDIYGLAPNDARVREAHVHYEGPAVAVSRSACRIADEEDGSDLEGHMLYLIDIRKHASSYALLDSAGERLGWAVFDEGDRASGPFVAATLSLNNAGVEKKPISANILVLKETGVRGSVFVRVGMGELTQLRGAKFERLSLDIT
jgi:hypothetical protein